MEGDDKVKNRLLKFAIKTPLAALLIVIITFVSLYFIAITAEVDLYVQAQGIVDYDLDQKVYIIKANIDSERIANTWLNTPVIWYFDPKEERTKTVISAMEETEIGVSIFVDADNLEGKDGQKVYLEIFQKKVKVIDKILRY